MWKKEEETNTRIQTHSCSSSPDYDGEEDEDVQQLSCSASDDTTTKRMSPCSIQFLLNPGVEEGGGGGAEQEEEDEEDDHCHDLLHCHRTSSPFYSSSCLATEKNRNVEKQQQQHHSVAPSRFTLGSVRDFQLSPPPLRPTLVSLSSTNPKKIPAFTDPQEEEEEDCPRREEEEARRGGELIFHSYLGPFAASPFGAMPQHQHQHQQQQGSSPTTSFLLQTTTTTNQHQPLLKKNRHVASSGIVEAQDEEGEPQAEQSTTRANNVPTRTSTNDCNSVTINSTTTTTTANNPAQPNPPRPSVKLVWKGIWGRKRLTEHQRATLEAFFQEEPTPNTRTREQVASQIGMTPRSVQLWYLSAAEHNFVCRPSSFFDFAFFFNLAKTHLCFCFCFFAFAFKLATTTNRFQNRRAKHRRIAKKREES